MLKRCHNKNSASFHRYGGRGIFVCRRWRKSFENFYKDMGKKPTNKHTIERVDNNGPYGPWNCIWATRSIRGRNKYNNVWLTYKGEQRLLTDLAKENSMQQRTLKQRVDSGVSVEDAVTKPVFKPPEYLFRGEMLTLVKIAKIIGMNVNTLKVRVGKLGWSLEKAINTPVDKRFKNKTS